MKLALVGNQNSGKTTLYNAFSGKDRHVGNFPGVTVDVQTSAALGISDCEIVDLPGVYSLRPYSEEERVTREYLLHERPDGIINVVDATCPARGLYLTTRVLELGIPTVVALNMIDEVETRGGSIDTETMAKMLGVPVVAVSASRRRGITELLATAVRAAKDRAKSIDTTSSSAVDYCVCCVERIISANAEKTDLPVRFAAALAIEGDTDILSELGFDDRERAKLGACVRRLEQKTGLDAAAACAAGRYERVDCICRKCVSQVTKILPRGDAAVLNGFLAYPIFLSVIALVFYLTFDVIGKRLSDLAVFAVGMFTAFVSERLTSAEVHPVMVSLVTDGALAGVGAVVSFLPLVTVLFFFLSVLEDTGYMARVAFIMDAPLRRLGLSGKSIVPLLLGFGCSVPAVMASRTLPTERDRRVTVMLVPYMSCGAKIPIYALMTAAFFPEHSSAVIGVIYASGIAVAILAALFHRRFSRETTSEYMLELPPWRFPTARGILRILRRRVSEFLSRAFGVIFLASLSVWFLSSFDLHLNITYDQSESLIAAAGSLISPVFEPLGFGDWRAAAALLAGLSAKEAVVGTLAVLLGTDGIGCIFTHASACSFLAFTLLYTPCAAAMSAIRVELGGWRPALRVLAAGIIVAWCVSAVVYRIALAVVWSV